MDTNNFPPGLLVEWNFMHGRRTTTAWGWFFCSIGRNMCAKTIIPRPCAFLRELLPLTASPPSSQILDSKHPGCIIRQLVPGPITDNPGSSGLQETHQDRLTPVVSAGSADGGERFAFRRVSVTVGSSNGSDVGGSDGNDTKTPALNQTASSFANRPSIATGTTVRPPAAAAETKVDGITEQEHHKAPGWESKGDGGDETLRASSFNRRGSSYPADMAAVAGEKEGRQSLLPLPPVSANGERSYLEATLDAGLSPTAAVAAGWEPTASARGLQASVAAKAITVSFVGATVVLGPVIGRVTQGSALILVEVGSKAPVACVLTDGVSGGQHRQVGMNKYLREDMFLRGVSQ